MKITKYGHAAFLIEDGEAKLLLDPGSFSSGFEELTGLTAVLYTHIHGDHYDETKLKAILSHNPDVQIVADEQTAEALEKAGHKATVAHEGDELTLGGAKIKVFGHDHAVIHPDFPIDKNVGYLIGGRAFYPGDALTVPGDQVEILLLPVESPWSKVSEVIDYLREVKPKTALPAHELILATPHMYYDMVGRMASGAGVDWRPMNQGETVEL